jgi:hypothetical protein
MTAQLQSDGKSSYRLKRKAVLCQNRILAIKRGLELDVEKVQHYNRDLINQRATKTANAELFKGIYSRMLASEAKANR